MDWLWPLSGMGLLELHQARATPLLLCFVLSCVPLGCKWKPSVTCLSTCLGSGKCSEHHQIWFHLCCVRAYTCAGRIESPLKTSKLILKAETAAFILPPEFLKDGL